MGGGKLIYKHRLTKTLKARLFSGATILFAGATVPSIQIKAPETELATTLRLRAARVLNGCFARHMVPRQSACWDAV